MNQKNKRTLVTGGAGYIGSILVRNLLEEGHEVVCIDNLKFGGSSLIGIWDHPNFTFREVDITNFTDIDKIITSNKYFAIVHLAAIVGDPACKLEPDLAMKTNKGASIHLIERVIQSNISRFIFASTCSNYGRMDVSDGYVDETSSLAPVSLYAELKVEIEDLLLNKTQKEKGFSPTSLRFATAFGISPRMRFDLTINEFTKELALDRELAVYGEQFWRPYCHVRDLVRAILITLKADEDKVAYNAFNVGDTSQNYTKKMIVDELVKQVPDARVKYVKKEEDPRDYRVKFDKIGDWLGFGISKTVPEGIKDILGSVRCGVIKNPDNQQYYNVPISK